MASSTTSSSLARSRSLRSNSLKPSALNPHATIVSTPGPSNITLFITNLRLLELDLRDDWPGITAGILSSSTRQENQKKRITCVEWALYHLFAIWDPEETRNKLQPFFPPLEPLQSLNLRAALFRCLDHAKKNGVLGRDAVLRKTMLDDCKGERLEEVLAVFSNTVLKKVLQDGGSDGHEAISHHLAYENFSYTGERTVLLAVILAHKSSLGSHIRRKAETRAKFRDFSNLLDLNDRRIVRRHEQLKELINEGGSQETLSHRDAHIIQDQVQINWSGSDEWLETILHGDSRFSQDRLLATPFEQVWKHVETNSIGDIEGQQDIGLLEQLDARVRDQEIRIARWQEFQKTLSKPSSGSPSKKKEVKPTEAKIDLGFDLHQGLQIGRTVTKASEAVFRPPLDDYAKLIENMNAQLSGIGKPQVPTLQNARQRLHPVKRLPIAGSPPASQEKFPSGNDMEQSLVIESEEPSLSLNDYAANSKFQTSPSETILRDPEMVMELPIKSSMPPPAPRSPSKLWPAETPSARNSALIEDQSSPSPKRISRTPPPINVPNVEGSESDLAVQIVNSVSTASPSPRKQRNTLSLAERTRLSLARTSHSQFSELHNDCDNLADLPQLSIRSQPSKRTSLAAPADDDKHAALIERTRKSMAGFEAAQKNAQIERRRSVKDAKKKQRESTYFPRLEEEEVVVVTPGIDKQELMEGDPDYESVFKSRPKIKTSPAVSPTRAWPDEGVLGD